MHSQERIAFMSELLVLHSTALLIVWYYCNTSEMYMVSKQSLMTLGCLMSHYKEVLAVNMWSSAQLTRPKREPNPPQEPYVSPARPSIILTAALNLRFFFTQLQAAVNSLTCT